MKNNGLRIILFDLETLTNLPEAMKFFPSLGDYPGLTLRASINSIICCGWKVLGEKRTHCINAWDFPKRWRKSVNDDYEVVKAAAKILQDADVVVTHNGKRFDWKFLQTRLLFHKLPPLPPILHIDTCQESKKHLYVLNNRLNTLAKFLKQPKKLENGGWDLWVAVSNREEKAMRLMEKYCKQDVRVLEGIFNEMRPFMKSLPNVNALREEGDLCANCGGQSLRKNGFHVTRQGRKQRLQCLKCGSWSLETKKGLLKCL